MIFPPCSAAAPRDPAKQTNRRILDGIRRAPPLCAGSMAQTSRKVDSRLPGKGNANFHGARPFRLIIKMIKWIRTKRLSMKNSLSGPNGVSSKQNVHGANPEGSAQGRHFREGVIGFGDRWCILLDTQIFVESRVLHSRKQPSATAHATRKCVIERHILVALKTPASFYWSCDL